MSRPSSEARDAGRMLSGAIYVADITARRAIGLILDRFFTYDEERMAYLPRGPITVEELKRTLEEAL